MKKIVKEELLTLEYMQGRSRPEDGYFEGGVAGPQHLEQLGVCVQKELRLNMVTDEMEETGAMQVSISGNRDVLFNLGRYLVAVARLDTEDPDYHDHFDSLKHVNGCAPCRLIVRLEP
ncbi:MAG: hypothetical protein R2834_05615 [Rhodothermales bacterium]